MTKSMRPNLAKVASTAAFSAAGSRTSAAAGRHLPPVAFCSASALSARPLALHISSTPLPFPGSLSADNGCVHTVAHHRFGDLVAYSTSACLREQSALEPLARADSPPVQKRTLPLNRSWRKIALLSGMGGW